MDLTGKTALISGGCTGIGIALAKRFVNDGAKVCITGRREAVLAEAAAWIAEHDAETRALVAERDGERVDVFDQGVADGGRASAGWSA